MILEDNINREQITVTNTVKPAQKNLCYLCSGLRAVAHIKIMSI